MTSLTYSIVDVFAERKYAGNQLAVFRHTAGVSSAEMQAIAKEMNYSETTFIISDETRNGGYDVRIFTPEEEIPFAGHPTLGTAYVIRQELAGAAVQEIKLNLKAGVIPVRFEDKLLWMRQLPPVFGQTHAAPLIVEMLGIKPGDIDDRFPIQEVSTGLSSLIVPLRSLEAVKRCRTDRQRCLDYVAGIESKVILVFAPEAYEERNQLNARVFVDYFGVPEDPATGSACGNLAGYLVKHRLLGGTSIDLKVEQGYEIGRPSVLHLRAEESGGDIAIQVGGSVVPVAKGEWLQQDDRIT